jgi:hypothetical protein
VIRWARTLGRQLRSDHGAFLFGFDRGPTFSCQAGRVIDDARWLRAETRTIRSD